MKKSLFLKQLGAYLLVILILAASISYFSYRSIRSFHLKNRKSELEKTAEVLKGRIAPLLENRRIDDLDRFVKEIGRNIQMRITVVSETDVLVDARVEIEEFEEYFSVTLPEGKFETLGGFIFYIIRKIPVTGEVIIYEDFELTIESADERSIKKVRVRRTGGTTGDS